MASTPSSNPPEREERIAALKKQIGEEEPKILPALQGLVRQAHMYYNETFEKLRKSTNDRIIGRLRIHTSMIVHMLQDLVDHDVNDYFSPPSAVRNLMLNTLASVTRGLQDLHDQGRLMLSGDELKEFMAAKKETTAQLKRHQAEIQDLVDKVALLQAKLAGLEKKPGKKSRKASSAKVRCLLKCEIDAELI